MKKKIIFLVLLVGVLVYTVYSNLLGMANQGDAFTTFDEIQRCCTPLG